MKSCAKLKTIPTPHLAQDFVWVGCDEDLYQDLKLDSV